MKVGILVLADFAEAHNGKFTIVGGGLQHLTVKSFPATRQRLFVAARLLFRSGEPDQSYVVSLGLIGPDGQAAMPPIQLHIYAPPLIGSAEDTSADFVYDLSNVAFRETGTYTVTVDDGADRIGETSFLVASEEQPSSAIVWPDVLQRGYEAFREGRLDEAEGLFREVVREAPEVPDGHNNLGFTLLGTRRYEEALSEFLEAEKLGFEHRGLLDANIACCLYGLNRFHEALDRFVASQSQSAPAQSVLYGIRNDEVFVVRLDSATDYVALGTLNLAWCAFRLGMRPEARNRAELTRLLVIEGTHDSMQIGSSVELLRHLLSKA